MQQLIQDMLAACTNHPHTATRSRELSHLLHRSKEKPACGTSVTATPDISNTN